MNFSRSTPAPKIGYRPRSSGEGPSGASFEVGGMKSAGVTTNAGNAADAVSTGAIYSNLRKNAPKYDQIVNTAAENRMSERISAMNAEATMAAAGIQAAGAVAQAEETAKGLEAQASAAKTGGMMSAIGGIASAALPLMLSDEETKHTIDEIEYACDVLRQLRPVTFFYKEEYSAHPERMHYGFIAQEYQKVMPDATYYDESVGKLCIDTNELISLLVRANQELETRITRLEAKQALAAV